MKLRSLIVALCAVTIGASSVAAQTSGDTCVEGVYPTFLGFGSALSYNADGSPTSLGTHPRFPRSASVTVFMSPTTTGGCVGRGWTLTPSAPWIHIAVVPSSTFVVDPVTGGVTVMNSANTLRITVDVNATGQRRTGIVVLSPVGDGAFVYPQASVVAVNQN